jgi:hypothetical protein
LAVSFADTVENRDCGKEPAHKSPVPNRGATAGHKTPRKTGRVLLMMPRSDAAGRHECGNDREDLEYETCNCRGPALRGRWTVGMYSPCDGVAPYLHAQYEEEQEGEEYLRRRRRTRTRTTASLLHANTMYPPFAVSVESHRQSEGACCSRVSGRNYCT